MASYFHHSSALPLTSDTIPRRFDECAAKNPSKDAIVVYNLEQGKRESLSFKDISDGSMMFAASLLPRGFKKGSRVMVMLPNCKEFLVVIMALCRLGINVIFPTPGTEMDKLLNLFSKYDCASILTLSSYCTGLKQRLKNSQNENPALISIICIDEESQLHHVLSGQSTSDKDLDVAAVQKIQEEIQPDDPAFVFHTSGSTGEPKYVQHTHFTLINAVHQFPLVLRIDEDSVIFNERPMCWMGGFTLGVMPVFCLGSILVSVCMSAVENPHVQQICDILAGEKCTDILALIYMMCDLIHFDALHTYDLSSLKHIMTGGQPASSDIIMALMEKLSQATIHNLYGSTEGQMSALEVITGLPDSGLGNVTPMPHYEMKIVDVNDRITELNESGELCVRGPGLLTEYLDSDVTKMKISPSRWFRTGDAAVMPEKGKIRVYGRTDDLIKRAGLFVMPNDVENVILQHPGIQNVVIVGIPDERLYMEICACVIMKAGYIFNAEEMAAWCDQKFCTLEGGFSSKPRYFLAMDEFPLTLTGKINRRMIKETAEAKFAKLTSRSM